MKLPQGALIAALAVILYARTLVFTYTMDDVPGIVHNPSVTDATRPIGSLFTADFWGEDLASDRSHKSYRPLTVLTFRMQYAMTGLSTVALHAGNVALHAAASVLVWAVTARVLVEHAQTGVLWRTAAATSHVPFMAGILFAAHPIHVENVAGLVGRADILCAVAALLAVCAWLDGRTKTALGLALAGMGAKEIGMAVFLLLPLLDLVGGPTKARPVASRGARAATALGVFAVATAIRLSLHGEQLTPRLGVDENPIPFLPAWHERAMSYAFLHAYNLYLLLFPLHLSADYSYNCIPSVVALADARNAGTLAAYALVGGTAALAFHRRNKTLLFAVLWGVVTFLPAANIVSPVGTVVAERLLYVPSVGFAVLAALAIDRTGDRLKWPLLVLVVALYATRTAVRNEDWRSNGTLLPASLNVCPDSARSQQNYGYYLLRHQRHDEAEPYLRRAIDIRPESQNSLGLLGQLLFARRRIDEARPLLERSLELARADQFNRYVMGTMSSLGSIYAMDSEREMDARTLLFEAVEVGKIFSENDLEQAALHDQFAVVLDLFQQTAEARVHHKRAQSLGLRTARSMRHFATNLARDDDGFAAAMQTLGDSLKLAFESDEELNENRRRLCNLYFLAMVPLTHEREAVCRQAVAASPDAAQIHFDFGKLLHIAERFDEADELLRAAHKLGHREAAFAVGQIHFQRENDDESARWMRKSIRNGFKEAEAHLFLAVPHARRGESTQALAELDAGLAVSPENWELLKTKAQVLAVMDGPSGPVRARPYIERALRNAPADRKPVVQALMDKIFAKKP